MLEQRKADPRRLVQDPSGVALVRRFLDLAVEALGRSAPAGDPWCVPLLSAVLDVVRRSVGGVIEVSEPSVGNAYEDLLVELPARFERGSANAPALRAAGAVARLGIAQWRRYIAPGQREDAIAAVTALKPDVPDPAAVDAFVKDLAAAIVTKKGPAHRAATAPRTPAPAPAPPAGSR